MESAYGMHFLSSSAFANFVQESDRTEFQQYHRSPRHSGPEGGHVLLGNALVIRDKFGWAGWHIRSVAWDSKNQTGSGEIS